MIRFKCPHCETQYILADNHAGENFVCEICRREFLVQKIASTESEQPKSTSAVAATSQFNTTHIEQQSSLKAFKDFSQSSEKPMAQEISVSASAMQPGQPAIIKKCGFAIASMILGICSYLCFGLLASIPAVVLGHIALSKIKQSSGSLEGRGMALAGLILGYINIGIFVLLLILIVGGMLTIGSIGSIGSHQKSFPTKDTNAATQTAMPGKPLGKNEVLGSIVAKIDNQERSLSGIHIYIVPEETYQKIQTQFQDNLAEMSKNLQTLESNQQNQYESAKNQLAQSMEEIKQKLKDTQVKVDGLQDKILAQKNKMQIQQSKIETLKKKYYELTTEYEKFKDPIWKKFQVRAIPPERTIDEKQRATMGPQYEAAIRETQAQLDTAQKEYEQIMNGMQKLQTEQSNIESEMKDNQLELKNKETEMQRIESTYQSFHNDHSKRVREMQKSLLDYIRSTLDAKNEILRVRSDVQGQFIYEKPKSYYYLIAWCYTEEKEPKLLFWEYRARPEEKAITLDNEYMSDRFHLK